MATYFAAAYDCGAYGTDTYNNAQTCTQAATPTPSSNWLASTGADVWLPLILGVIMIAGSVALLIRQQKRRRQEKQTNA